MGSSFNMRLLSSFLLLAWCPCWVLGDMQIVVQTNGGVLKPGQVLNWAVSANPIPDYSIALVLIGTTPDAGGNGGATFWPWDFNMTTSPKSGAITIPSNVPPKLYTVDAHRSGSIYNPLLGRSNVFEIVANTQPTTQPPVVQTTKQTTTVVTTAQQTQVVQQPPSQADPTSQDPIVTTKATTTQGTPASNTPTTNNAASPSSQSGSAGSAIQTLLQSSIASIASSSPSPTADTSVSPDSPGTSEKKKSSAIGPAIGGAIGGIIVILLLLFLWRRHMQRKNGMVTADDMVESNSRYRDADSGTTSVVSPFASTYREFQPNRGNTAVSPFLLDSERSPPPTSPDPAMSSKYREAFGGGSSSVVHSGKTHHPDMSVTTSEQLRSEREQTLGEISALQSAGGHGSSAYAQSAVSAGSSGARDGASDEEVRNRLDQLTQHVARLESALRDQAANTYEAPPTYIQARPPSEFVPQRG